MKTPILSFVCCCILFSGLAQTPFTTLVKEPIYIERDGSSGKFVASTKAAYKANFARNTDYRQSDADGVDFFNSNSLALNLLSHGDSRVAVSSTMLHYKLYFANPILDDASKSKDREYRWNIPFLLITKLSTNYDSINASGALDLVDYNASPVTLRIMPSWKLTKNTKFTDKLYFGLYTDIRGLNVPTAASPQFNLKMCGSGGIGFTFQGDGSAGTYNNNGSYVPGKYSLSVIAQTSVGDKNVISSLFNTQKNYITSFQAYLVFFTADKSYLNFKLGYQYFSHKTITGNRSTFSFSIGI
jgi:hypothetical protein